MYYDQIVHGTFLCRKNRFIAQVLIDGQEITSHVKNTGRLRELLTPGADVLLEYHPNAEQLGRKTSYSLIGVYKEEAGYQKERLLINIDSQIPNAAAAAWLKDGSFSQSISDVKREVTFGNSRFDLSFTDMEQACLMEVKGVTLESAGISCFPDAPTERGVKHVMELISAVKEGYNAYILFVIQMKGIKSFTPNRITHPEFADALTLAGQSGVRILAYDCLVEEHSLVIDQPVPVLI